MKKLAVYVLAMAIAAIGVSFWFNQRAASIYGPSALAVMPDQSVWLSVDAALWHVSPEGHLLTKIDNQSLGLKGVVGNIALHPSGQLVLGIADQVPLSLFNPATAKVEKILVPQWPSELVEHASRAIRFVFSPSGLLAISTGGGHAVALFDAQGQFLRRSAPGLYRFTNGLWWEGETLWTTNTNGLALIQMAPESMTPLKSIAVNEDDGFGKYLGTATASRGLISDHASGAKPVATVFRFAYDRIHGTLVDIFDDGSQSEYATALRTEPRDFAWQSDTLLVIDGDSYGLKQYANDRRPLADFGDVAFQKELEGLHKRRADFKRGHDVAVYVGIAAFLIGLALAALSKRQTQVSLPAQAITPFASAMVVLPPGRFVRKSFLFIPFYLFTACVCGFALKVVISPGWMHEKILILGVWSWVILFVALLIVGLAYRRFVFERAGQLTEWESVINADALQRIAKPALAQTLWLGEVVYETFMLLGLTQRWVVVTQQRTLVFAVTAFECVFRQEIANIDIVRTKLLDRRSLSWWELLQTLLVSGVQKLNVSTAAGISLSGYVVSVVTAKRVVKLLNSSLVRQKELWPVHQASVAVRSFGTLSWQMLATILIPGLGQWMQRRTGAALWFFLWFAVPSLQYTIPLLWNMVAPRTEVSSGSIQGVAQLHVFVVVLALWNCWSLRPSKQ